MSTMCEHLRGADIPDHHTEPGGPAMNPTELHLFNGAEQTLLVQTERGRLALLDEDELDELFTRVRRARTKYTKLYRRQSGTTSGRAPSGSSTSKARQASTKSSGARNQARRDSR
ncbi:MAG TPA: hypothetical protein VLN74_15320 [Ilumatobacteraceae bacterium]|nr:hypothetical protein [Ilumatobacteraceae bacterium]